MATACVCEPGLRYWQVTTRATEMWRTCRPCDLRGAFAFLEPEHLWPGGDCCGAWPSSGAWIAAGGLGSFSGGRVALALVLSVNPVTGMERTVDRLCSEVV